MQALLFQLLASPGRFAACRGKAKHEGTLLRILQGCLNRVRYDLFHALFDVVLQVKCVFHGQCLLYKHGICHML